MWMKARFLQNLRWKSRKAANYDIMKIYPDFSSSPSYFPQGMWANGKGDGRRGKEVWIFLMSLFNPRVTFSTNQRQSFKSQTRLFTIFLSLPSTFLKHTWYLQIDGNNGNDHSNALGFTQKINFLVENSLCMMYVIVCARDIRNKRNDNCGKYGAGDMTFVRFKTWWDIGHAMYSDGTRPLCNTKKHPSEGARCFWEG